MSLFRLKLIAVLAMITDHVGAVLFPQYIILRIIGRITFPIMAFLIGNGYVYTKNIKKYILRLALFAIISEPVFDFCFDKGFSHQNIFFTLLLGLICIYIFDKMFKEKTTLSIILIALLIAAGDMLFVDYGGIGVLLILALYIFRKNKIMIFACIAGSALAYSLINVLSEGITLQRVLQMFSVASVPLILLYNNKPGVKNRFVKFGFYIIYPLHLLIIGLISRLL